MAVKNEQIEKNLVKLTFEVSAEDFDKAINQVYKKNVKKFNVPGYRKGKAPRKIIEKYYTEAVFYDEAINSVLPQAYDEALKESGVESVARPEIDVEEIKKGEPVVFTALVTTKPEVKLGDYKGIEVEKIDHTVTDEDVDKDIEATQKKNARLITVDDRAIENGDIAVIDFEGFVDDVAFEGGKGEDYELEIGSGTFIPGFEEQLVGVETDADVDVKVTFPEEYHAEDLKGKDAKFICTINEIKVKELPELDDNFASDVSEFDTLKEFKADLRKKLKAQFNEMIDAQRENKVLDKVIEETKFDVPNRMIEDEVENELRNFQYRLQAQGLNYEDYKKYTGNTDEEIKETFKEPAEKRVKLGLILEKYAQENKLKATKRDYDKELDKLAEMYKAEDKEEFKKTMSEGSLEFLDRGILNSKAIDDIKKKVKYI